MPKAKKNLSRQFRVKLRSKRVILRSAAWNRRPVKPTPTLEFSRAALPIALAGGPAEVLDTKQHAWWPKLQRKLSHDLSMTFRRSQPVPSPTYAYKARLNFGTFGVMSLGYAKLRKPCVSALVQAARRILARRAALHVRLATDRPVTARPAESRMGKGKGGLVYWEAAPKPGTVLFEICGTSRSAPVGLLRGLSKKTILALKPVV